jgi:hypothetical protein
VRNIMTRHFFRAKNQPMTHQFISRQKTANDATLFSRQKTVNDAAIFSRQKHQCRVHFCYGRIYFRIFAALRNDAENQVADFQNVENC